MCRFGALKSTGFIESAISSGCAGRGEDSVLVGSGAVYRRLLDPGMESCTISWAPGYDYEKEIGTKSTAGRARLEKSESEDSGVELPPHSPFGSVKSYSNDEPESLDLPCPEEPEPVSASPRKHSFTGDSSSEDPDTLDVFAPLKMEKVRIHRHGDGSVHREVSGVPLKLEQAVLRSRRQRPSCREPTPNWPNWSNRQYPGSLKDQRRGKHLYQRARSRSHPDSEDHDPMQLPGDGLLYLENLCGMLEQIAELQRRNQKLQQEKRQAEERLRNRVMFMDSCQCSASHPCKVPQSDTPDGSVIDARTRKTRHYRKRSDSHAGILRTLSQQPDNVLTANAKTQAHFVSVPNLQENNSHNSDRSKAEVSQWEKMKDLIFKLSRKASGGPAPSRTETNCRSSSASDVPSNAPRRLFLPGLVIRPSRKQSQQYR